MRTRFIPVLVVAFALASAGTADAQSSFLSKGQSGLGIGAGFGLGDGMNDLGGSVSASVIGVVDVGASFERLSFDENVNPDVSALQMSPFVSFHPLKMVEKVLPVQTTLGVAWQNTSYSGDALDSSEMTMKMQGWTFEGTAYGKFALSKTIDVLPDASVSHFIGTLESTDDVSGLTTEMDADQTFWGVGATLALKLPTRNVLSVRLGTNVDEDGDARFVTNLGFTLPLGLGS